MKRKGFTLIELLVVIAIIGLLSTLAVTALGGARKKARDARRLSDIKQIQTALEMYASDSGTYPITAGGITYTDIGVTGGSLVCLSSGGFGATGCANAYMAKIPAGPNTSEYYKYSAAAASTTYNIRYTLEQAVGDITEGMHYANPGGVANP
ncbi:MAG: putative General secretion pathway protein GspG [Parcubacteria group bacterium Athens1014_10]|nr:MAG: putative General secretion pathway protein GspG [Parcubacteria group bacterium Athens1014_10]TSD05227.1 MAG: putative General secretion pathway protein GspG [Parcubacteria group bacterium Athens0714_12]